MREAYSRPSSPSSPSHSSRSAEAKPCMERRGPRKSCEIIVESLQLLVDLDEIAYTLIELLVQMLDFGLGLFLGGDVAGENIDKVLGRKGSGGPAYPAKRSIRTMV